MVYMEKKNAPLRQATDWCPHWVLRFKSWCSISGLLDPFSLHLSVLINPEGTVIEAFLHILTFFFIDKYF